MLSVVLKILSILGILLLCLLGLAVLLILLVLFFPVCYRVSGRKDSEEMTVNARAWWLFGLLRASYVYPEPGRVLVKVLPFTVYDSGKEDDGKGKKSSGGADGGEREEDRPEKGRKEAEEAQEAAGKSREQTEATGSGQAQGETAEKGQTPGNGEAGKGREQTETSDSGDPADGGQNQDEAAQPEQKAPQEPSEEASEDAPSSFFEKFRKLKYTIRSIYDKIKNIWENISYYMDLLREEETKLLFSHVMFRLGKILKNIRPRRIRGQVLFGTGSPDTTGYAYGVYGMLSPSLGNRLLVMPDFTRAVLEGDIYLAGHITVFTLLWNVLKVLLDKKTQRFIKKMKAGRKK